MDVLSAIQDRRSIRQYSARPVDEDTLKKVLEAARLAPSGSNNQEWKFIVVKNEATRSKLADAANGQAFVKQAPVVIVACSLSPEQIMSCGQPRHTVDLSIAVSFMLLEIHELGLGTCWLGSYDEAKVKEILSIPEGVRIVTMIPVGFPADSPAQRPRKKLEEIVCYEKYE